MADRRVALIAAAVVVVGTGSVVAVTEIRHHAPSTVANAVPTGTATVTRTDLSTTTQVDGTLGYAGSYLIANQALGVYTALPAPGQTVRAGSPLYEVDGNPVILFYGQRPAWRNLSIGVPDGPDVAQLKQNLVSLGYGRLTVNDHFDTATERAVKRWQTKRGDTATGTVAMTDVVYAPGPIRVADLQASLGDPARPGTLLHATGTNPIVDVSIPVAQEYLIKPGDQVTVILPDGTTTVPGTITSVSQVAATASNTNGPTTEVVTATVALANPAAAGTLDQAPVEVNVTDQSVHGVLAVPINALVALAGGGYGVWLADHGTRRLIGVHTGLFSNTLVEVAGTGLAPGMTVEVPAS